MLRDSKVETLISLKSEINAQIEGQEDVTYFVFENMRFNKFTSDMTKLILRYPKLSKLEFNSCQLSNIETLVGLQNITKLSLQNNSLSNDAIKHIVANFPNLISLDLRGNPYIDDVKPLNELNQLQYLYIKDTKAAQEANIRDFLFKQQQLIAIDQLDRENQEVFEDDREEDDDDDLSDDDDEYESESEEQSEEEIDKLQKKVKN
ncbi:hypothetical protein pb186bvf_001560 [Paramecium bursaria]